MSPHAPEWGPLLAFVCIPWQASGRLCSRNHFSSLIDLSSFLGLLGRRLEDAGTRLHCGLPLEAACPSPCARRTRRARGKPSRGTLPQSLTCPSLGCFGAANEVRQGTFLLPPGKVGHHLMGPCCHPEKPPGHSSESVRVTQSLLSFLVVSLDCQATFPRRCTVFK